MRVFSVIGHREPMDFKVARNGGISVGGSITNLQ